MLSDDGSLVTSRSVVLAYGRRIAGAGLTFSIGQGVTAVVGRNGAGKSTLLSALATVKKPRSGDLSVLGVSTSDRDALRQARSRIGYLPQSFGYFANFTVYDFVTYCAWLKKIPDPDIRAAVDKSLLATSLSDVANSKMRTLSGGFVRRAGIAQAIVNDPALCILDEPTAGLDPEQRFEFRALLASLSQSRAIVLSTHMLDDIAAIADTVLVIERGRIVFAGTVPELEAFGAAGQPGHTALERGYSAVVSQAAPQVDRL